jgi:hypothetical protein
MVVTPYTQQTKDNTITRTFDPSTDQSELCWHRDRSDRTVNVVKGTGWKLQLDNQLPVVLEYNKNYSIPKEVYHRLIKGQDTLTVKILEHK